MTFGGVSDFVMSGKRKKIRGKGVPSQEFTEFLEIVEDVEVESDRSMDFLERDGDLAVDLLTKKIQLRKLADELRFIDDHSSVPTKSEKKMNTNQPRPQSSASKGAAVNKRKKTDVKKDVIEDEEVLKIIDDLEKEVDTDFVELFDMGPEETESQTPVRKDAKSPVEEKEEHHNAFNTDPVTDSLHNTKVRIDGYFDYDDYLEHCNKFLPSTH